MGQVPCIGLSWPRILIHLLGSASSTFTTVYRFGIQTLSWIFDSLDERCSEAWMDRRIEVTKLGTIIWCLRFLVGTLFFSSINIVWNCESEMRFDQIPDAIYSRIGMLSLPDIFLMFWWSASTTWLWKKMQDWCMFVPAHSTAHIWGRGRDVYILQ